MDCTAIVVRNTALLCKCNGRKSTIRRKGLCTVLTPRSLEFEHVNPSVLLHELLLRDSPSSTDCREVTPLVFLTKLGRTFMAQCSRCKEHIFVDHSAPSTTFAYTNYGGYDYWTDINQFLDDTINIYVVDEHGLKDSYEKAKELGDWNVLSMLIEASTEARNGRGVDSKRTDRDVSRTFDGIEFDFHVINNGSIDDLYKQLDNLKI